jgi:CobD/Cbib protein
MGMHRALRHQLRRGDTEVVECGALLPATRCQSLERIVNRPARPLLLAGQGVQGTECDEQLHVRGAHVPALPLAQRDAAAELGQRFIDMTFERQNGGYTPDPFGFEEPHLSGRPRNTVRGCVQRSPCEPDTILNECLVDQHQQRSETQRCQRGIRLTQSDRPGANLERSAVVAPAIDGSLGKRRRGAQEPLGAPCCRIKRILLDDVSQARNYAAGLVRRFAGLCSKKDPARAINDLPPASPGRMAAHRLDRARDDLVWLVSRPTPQLDAPLVAAAAIESLAENFVDSYLAPLLAYARFGLGGAYAYRAINTADAMWG